MLQEFIVKSMPDNSCDMQHTTHNTQQLQQWQTNGIGWQSALIKTHRLSSMRVCVWACVSVWVDCISLVIGKKPILRSLTQSPTQPPGSQVTNSGTH